MFMSGSAKGFWLLLTRELEHSTSVQTPEGGASPEKGNHLGLKSSRQSWLGRLSVLSAGLQMERSPF